MTSNTSWQVKAKYNKKVYRTVTAQLNKELVERLEEKLNCDGITKAEFIRRAIKEYLGEELTSPAFLMLSCALCMSASRCTTVFPHHI